MKRTILSGVLLLTIFTMLAPVYSFAVDGYPDEEYSAADKAEDEEHWKAVDRWALKNNRPTTTEQKKKDSVASRAGNRREDLKQSAEGRAKKEEALAKQAELYKNYARCGKGWAKTAQAVNQLKADIEKIPVVIQFREVQQNSNAPDRGTRMRGVGQADAISETLYRGSVISVMSGSGHLVQNNEAVDFNNWELFKYEKNADNGLHYVLTFASDITTLKISDGTNMILAKINMADPEKSRLSDANLPINAMNTITQVYQKKGISVSEKMLLSILEDWYKAELMSTGETLQGAMTGLLVDVDVRSSFLKFCKAQAKVAVKPVGDDE
jgi:hypothetical protein